MALCKWSSEGVCTIYQWKNGQQLLCPDKKGGKRACLGLIDELEDLRPFNYKIVIKEVEDE